MIDGFCQNGSCKKQACVQVLAPSIAGVESKDGIDLPVMLPARKLDLCSEDAAFFLEVRDAERPMPKAVEKFVKRCHKD